MIVTVATFSEPADKIEEGIRHIQEEVVPSIRGAAGLKAGYWVVNREAGERLSILIWNTAEDMAAAMPGVMASIKQIRERAGRSQPQRSPDRSQRYEVVAQV
jgi:hypothetical protein